MVVTKMLFTGGAAWIQHATGELDEIWVTGGSHLVIETDMAGVTLRGDDDSMMHIVGNSRVTVTSTTDAKMVFNTNTALVLTKEVDFTMMKKTDLFGQFEVQPTAKVYVKASLYLTPQQLAVKALTIDRTGSITVPTGTSPNVVTINTTNITFNGNFTAGIVILDNMHRFTVGNDAFVTFEPSSHNLLLGNIIDIHGNVNLRKIISFRRSFCEDLTINGGSLVMVGGDNMTLECKEVHINGLLLIKSQVNIGSGFDRFTVGPLGDFTFTLLGDFICDQIMVNGTFVSTTNIVMRGRIRDNIQSLGIGSAGRLILDSTSQKNGILTASSVVAVHVVNIDGAFLPGQLHIPNEGIQGGWDSLEIGVNGNMQFQPDGDFWCNFVKVSGRLKSYTPITIQGHNRQLEMIIDSLGSILFDSNSSHPHGPWSGRSSIMASKLNMASSSTMKAGYISLTVDEIEVNGRLYFEVSSVMLTDTFLIGSDGHVETANPVVVKGVTASRTRRFTVNGYTKFDTRGKHDTLEWSSSNASVLHVKNVAVGVGARFLAGYLSLADVVETLTVATDGKFEFQPATTFYIKSTEVAGQVKSYTPMVDGTHLKGERLDVKSTGTLDMDYNGAVNGRDSGCLPSYIHMTTSCYIAGTVQAGSLSVDTGDISVTITGQMIVTYGGYESQRGPGKMF